MSILSLILGILTISNNLLAIIKEVKEWRNAMALTDEEKEMVRNIAHKAIFLGLHALKVAGMSDEEVETDYALTKKEFDSFPPEKIGT